MCTRVVQGLVESIYDVTTMAIMIGAVPESQITMFIGMFEGVRMLGLTIGPLVGGWFFEAGGFYLVRRGQWTTRTGRR